MIEFGQINMIVEQGPITVELVVKEDGSITLAAPLKVKGGEVAIACYSPEASADLRVRAEQNGLSIEQQMATELTEAVSW